MTNDRMSNEEVSDCDALCACNHLGRSHTEVISIIPWRAGCRECFCQNFVRLSAEEPLIKIPLLCPIHGGMACYCAPPQPEPASGLPPLVVPTEQEERQAQNTIAKEYEYEGSNEGWQKLVASCADLNRATDILMDLASTEASRAAYARQLLAAQAEIQRKDQKLETYKDCFEQLGVKSLSELVEQHDLECDSLREVIERASETLRIALPMVLLQDTADSINSAMAILSAAKVDGKETKS